MKLPNGFEMSAVTAGIKPSGRPDLALVYSPFPLAWALTTTENRLRAPCVQRNRSRYVSSEPVRGVIVNAGNANCANGDRGVWDNEDFAGDSANALALSRPQEILTASTGVIGRPLPTEKIKSVLPKLVREMGYDTAEFAQAILTTDTRPKQVGATLSNGARIVGVAKGSGMIHPNMATMLAFVTTDASLAQDELRAVWPQVVDRSFNQITVDGDTSPNDMALLFSSQRAAADPREFEEALLAVCQKLAQLIVRDGEGATTMITVRARNARSEKEARTVAKAIAGSSLVKAAVHGRDPNWGRILSAAGQSGVVMDMSGVRIGLQGIEVYRGQSRPFDAGAVSKAMTGTEEVVIDFDLAAGSANGVAWGCDLSAEYVAINADYTT